MQRTSSSSGVYSAQHGGKQPPRAAFSASVSTQLLKASKTFVDRSSQQRAHNGNFGAVSSSSSSSSASSSSSVASIYSNNSNSYSTKKDNDGTEEMNFSNKKLAAEAVASVLHRYPKLKAVDLSRNKINLIPKGMPMHLVALDLSHNQFSTIVGMNRLSKLIEVKLTHNKISSMVGLSNAPTLQHIDLSHNRILAIEGTELLKDLRTLNVSYNKFKHLVNLRGLTFNHNLESLNLLHNEITSVASYRIRITNLVPSLVELDGNMMHSHRQQQPSYKTLHSPPNLKDSRLLSPASTSREDVNSTTMTATMRGVHHNQNQNHSSYYLNVTRGIAVVSDDDDDDDDNEEEVDKSNIPWRNPPKVAPRSCVWKGKDVRIGESVNTDENRSEFHYAIDYNLAVNKLHADLDGLTYEEKKRGVPARTRWMSPDHTRKTQASQSSTSSSLSISTTDRKGYTINHPLPIEYDPSLSLRNQDYNWFPPSSSTTTNMDVADGGQPIYTPTRPSKLDQLVSRGPISNNIAGGGSGYSSNTRSNTNDNNNYALDGSDDYNGKNSRNPDTNPFYNGMYDRKNGSTNATGNKSSNISVSTSTTIEQKQREIESKLKELNTIFNRGHDGVSNDNENDINGQQQEKEKEEDELAAIYRELDELDTHSNSNQTSPRVLLASISPISHINEESALTLNMQTPPPSRIRYDAESSRVDDDYDDDDGGGGGDGDSKSFLDSSIVTPSGKAIASAIQELMDKKKKTLAALNAARLNRKL